MRKSRGKAVGAGDDGPTMSEPPAFDGATRSRSHIEGVSSDCSIATAPRFCPQSQVNNLSFVVEMKGETVLDLHGKA